VVGYGPAFPGSSDTGPKFQPAGFVRWGRITITGAGGFTTRRLDDVERGLSAEVVRRSTWHLNVGLRVDQGRPESDSGDLAGMGSIPSTVRGRLSVRWEPTPDLRFGAAANADLLNKDGGIVYDFGVARHWHFGPDRSFTVSAAIGAADGRYMQAYHGVTAAQSASSGYPEFAAQAGLRDVRMGVVWRQEIGHSWTGFVGGGVSRLLGSAADSPLTRKPSGAGLQAGLAWRF
jgi:outer membrane scaffolding protein for murein synthesis (MipA/OmpV family)